MSNDKTENDAAKPMVTYEEVDDGAIAVITLDRPEARNAQNKQMTYQLNDAFTRAARTDSVKCIVLAANGPHFSAGHDLKGPGQYDAEPIWVGGSDTRGGAEGLMAYEEESYLHMCRRWHDIPKPTIAVVQGNVIAGGLMLMWVCDIIIASDDASFRDMTVEFGVNGVEWFNHPWEFGIRKAKELLFTGDVIDAAEAHRLGMVNHVVPRDELNDFALAMAGRIAAKPSFSLKLAKLAVNQTLDAQGFQISQQQAFGLQHVGHAHTRAEHLRETGIDMFPGADRPRRAFEPPAPDA
ncbi:putative enoyl-CoA hydratase [Ilumatobacter coccineus YM16-304]|uniref:Putative enoyl-CoA hydratase n=2 Tax=Ilumatobacter coccineus TaxID=467094 RepID=A0A6C7EG91_ILUCY|nr:enoyl-CoA hydratase [Ilumatobacter coccineus]BAN04005.1 putative enoyl-CoA hydratase [Ilumatobacter coccineus YM16-304]